MSRQSKNKVHDQEHRSSPVQDDDYGYRQRIVRDPEGHEWLIQKKI
jgi:uncharacterized glyoxalase superfamily protein PhnB